MTLTRAQRQRKYIRELRHTLVGVFGGVCDECGGTHRLEFAHKDHTQGDIHGYGRGSNKRIRDVRDHPDFYMLKCHECHQAYDQLHDQVDVTQLSRDEYMARQAELEQALQQEPEWPGDYYKI